MTNQAPPLPSPSADEPRVRAGLDRARNAQAAWAAAPLPQRLAVVRRARHALAAAPQRLLEASPDDRAHARAEVLASEIIPLADALKFLEKNAARVLRTQRLGARGRPGWLRGSAVEITRDPLGVVLVIAPGNYPALLPGVQVAQALAAGNAVMLKPAAGKAAAAEALAALFTRAGLDSDLLQVLPDTVAAGQAATKAGVDHVVLTGSLETGRAVLRDLAQGPTPATMELSGCDAVFVRAEAELDLVASALRFGLTLNGSRTCIAPRRVFVARDRSAALIERLESSLLDTAAVALPEATRAQVRDLITGACADGARIVVGAAPTGDAMSPTVLTDVRPSMEVARSDIFAPVLSILPVEDDEDALRLAAACPYALGATIFGEPRSARAFARRVRAGVVVVNDIIAPTADPRVPFGGRGHSGFGVTRGADGLLAMTAPKTVIVRHGRSRKHLEPLGGDEEGLFLAWLRAAHAEGLSGRVRGIVNLCREGAQLARRKKTEE